MSKPRSAAQEPASPPADAISLEQAAEILGASPTAVLRLIENGHLKPWGEKPALVFSPAKVRAYRTRSERVRQKALEDMTAITEELGL